MFRVEVKKGEFSKYMFCIFAIFLMYLLSNEIVFADYRMFSVEISTTLELAPYFVY